MTLIISADEIKPMTYKTLPKPSSSNKQIQEYVEAARKGLASQFVMKSKLGWKVYPASQMAAATDAMIFETKKEAIDYAQKRAHSEGGDVFLYSRDGDKIARIQ